MRFPIPDDYKVVFKHTEGPSRYPVVTRPVDRKMSGKYPGLKAVHPTIHITIARIYAGDNRDEPIAEGQATQNPNDQHCRRIGRDIARGRAAKALAEKLVKAGGPPFDNSWDPGDRYDPLG